MSLRVWLPLDGTLENKGVDNVAVSNNGATVDNNGKIGQCYTFNSQYISVTNMTPLQNVWSACCWCKQMAASNNASNYFLGMNVTNTSNITFLLCAYNREISIYTGNSNTRRKTGYTMTRDVWYHLCITYDGTTLSAYVNGTKVYSLANPTAPVQSSQLMLAGRYGLGGNSNISLNDVRIYDHCLSNAEVHEISLGLVRHYKLDNNGCKFDNLLTNAADAKTVTLTSTSAYTSYYYFATGAQSEIVINKNAQFIMEYDYEVDESTITASNPYIYFQLNGTWVSQPSSYIYLNTVGYSGHIRHTFTMTSEQANYTSSFRIRFRLTSANAGAVYTISNVVLHFKTVDSIKNIIVDSSGYNKNGTVVGTTSVDTTTPCYSCATHMNCKNTNNRVEAESLPSTTQTVSLWLKSTTTGSPVIFSDPLSEICLCLTSGYAAVQRATSKKTCYSLSNYSTTNWNHMVITKNGTQYGLWVNGIQAEASGTNYWTHNGDLLWLFNRNLNSSYGADASISDFRAYVTLLSANDIVNLYQTEARIDKNGNIHAMEFKEPGNEAITNNGQVIGHNIMELCPTLHYDKDIYIEPDGSKWVHIFHHNAPTENGLFSTTDTFATGVYLDANRWYDIEQFVSHMSIYEFMVKQKRASTSDEEKYRWIQTVSPLTAAYADVSPSSGNITFNTSSEYESSSYGGMLYGTGANTRMRIANATSSNWYGAMGAVIYSSDNLPGYPKTMISTGYLDLYARIDNLPSLPAKIIKDHGFYGNNLIKM